MKEIPLTQGRVAIVDDKDFESLSQFKWCAIRWSGGHYAARSSRKGKPKTITMHRFLMGTPKGMHTDHINGDGLDNRRENLRICTPIENYRNQSRHRSGRKLGTSYVPITGRYIAQWWNGLTMVKIGTFASEEEAHRAYLDYDRTHKRIKTVKLKNE